MLRFPASSCGSEPCSAPTSTTDEFFDADAFKAEVDAAIEEALAVPKREPTPAEIHASVERQFAFLERKLGIAPPPLLISANDDPAPELEDHIDLHGAVASAPAMRDLVKKRPARRLRRSGLRDLNDARTARTWRRSLWEAHGGALNRGLHQHPSTPIPLTENPSESSSKHCGETPHTPLSKSSTKTPKPDNDNRGLASWEDAGIHTRILYINDALDAFGVPFAFSVNLGPEVIRGANDNARGFLDYVKRRITRELNKALQRASTFWMVIETTEGRKPHVHGGIALNHNDDLPTIRRALERAGGRWTSNGTDTQVDLEPTRYQDTWASYPLKRHGRTRRHLRELAGLAANARVPIFSATADLRTAGKRVYAFERAKINAGR